MIKKYICVSLLVLSFFFLGIDKAEASVNRCICHISGDKTIGIDEFEIVIENDTLHSNIIGTNNVLDFYSHLGYSAADTIKENMLENDTCLDVYLVPEIKTHWYGDEKTGKYFINNGTSYTAGSSHALYEAAYNCSVPSSEENYYRSGELYKDLYEKLDKSKTAYENCLKSTCSNLEQLKKQFETDLEEMKNYRVRLYEDNNINPMIYTQLFEQVDGQFMVEYEKWIASGLVEDYRASCGLISKRLEEKLIWFLDIIKYGGVVLAIGLGMLDFLKAVLSDEGDANKKAIQKFIKRLIAAAVIFLLPLIIQFLITTVNINGVDKSNPFCVELR